MRTLMIMRHGKSKWPDDGRPDSDRPLAKRGKRDALRMGKILQERDCVPDIVATSPAKRARVTAKRLVRAWEPRVPRVVLPDLYDRGLGGCLSAIQSLPEKAYCALIIGHNPAFETLVRQLTGEWVMLKTAVVACVDLPVDSWDAVDVTTHGTLQAVFEPNDSTIIQSDDS